MFWLGAAVALCYVPEVTGAHIATQWPVLGVLLCYGLLRKGPFTTYHAIGLLFVAWAYVGARYSPYPDLGMFGLWLIVILWLALWFGTTLDDVEKRRLYAGLAFGAGASSLLALASHMDWLTYLAAQWPPLAALQLAKISSAPAGLYLNGVQQGAILAIVAVALITERMWFWVLPLLPGLWLAQSRGAFFALAAGLLACYVRSRTVLVAVAVACAVYFSSEVLPVSDAERMKIWRAAWDHLNLWGNGTGLFYAIMLTGPSGAPYFPQYVHNDWLQLSFEHGVGALGVFAIFGYAACRTDATEWPVVVVFVTAACYSMPLFMPVAAFVAFVAVGRILRDYGLRVRVRNQSGQSVVQRWRHRNSEVGSPASA